MLYEINAAFSVSCKPFMDSEPPAICLAVIFKELVTVVFFLWWISTWFTHVLLCIVLLVYLLDGLGSQKIYKEWLFVGEWIDKYQRLNQPTTTSHYSKPFT